MPLTYGLRMRFTVGEPVNSQSAYVYSLGKERVGEATYPRLSPTLSGGQLPNILLHCATICNTC